MDTASEAPRLTLSSLVGLRCQCGFPMSARTKDGQVRDSVYDAFVDHIAYVHQANYGEARAQGVDLRECRKSVTGLHEWTQRKDFRECRACGAKEHTPAYPEPQAP